MDQHRSLVVDTTGPWALYAPTIPPGWRALGVVCHSGGDRGALFCSPLGVYCQANASAIRSLDQSAVARALAREAAR